MGTIDNMLDRFEEKKKRVERLARALTWDACREWDSLTVAEQIIMRSRAMDILDYMDTLE